MSIVQLTVIAIILSVPLGRISANDAYNLVFMAIAIFRYKN